MKTFLFLTLLDCAASALMLGLFFWLKRRADSITQSLQGGHPLKLSLRQMLQLIDEMNKARPLVRSAPRWAVSQGLTLFEELALHRRYRDGLVKYCGTDDTAVLMAAMEYWREQNPFGRKAL